MRARKIVRVGATALAAVFLSLQLVPVERTNPPVTGDVEAPPAVAAVLRRACYDCHSNETRWPWYARVAPVSWLVARDVREARDELNFSTFDETTERERLEVRREVWEEVEEEHMPPWFYLPLHPGARLSDADRDVLRGWAGR